MLKNFLNGEYLVAHACGVYNNQTYPNSLEAFELSYGLGFRIFEIDLTFSSDGIFFCYHGDGSNLSFEANTQKIKKEGKGTALKFEDLCNLLLKFQDVYFITDTKKKSVEGYKPQFDYMSNVIMSIDEKLFERFIIMFYNEQMFLYLRQNYKFTTYLYSLNHIRTSEQETGAIKFVSEHKIPSVTMWEAQVKSEFVKGLTDAGALVFTHIVDNVDNAKKWFEAGVYGLYTNTLQLKDVSEIRSNKKI
jgi:glycerophosphoryl diester phosphodiesterase